MSGWRRLRRLKMSMRTQTNYCGSDGVEGHVGGELGFQATMVFKRTDRGTCGILAMTNVFQMYLEDHRRDRWFTNYYAKLIKPKQVLSAIWPTGRLKSGHHFLRRN